MIQLQDYPIISEALSQKKSTVFGSMVCIANVNSNDELNFENTVVSDNSSYITVNHNDENMDNYIGKYAVTGREIVKINSYVKNVSTVDFYISRGQLGTINSYTATHTDNKINENYSFRVVEVFDNVTKFTFDSKGSTSTPFSFELEQMTVEIKDKVSNWNIINDDRKYKIRNNETTVYIFRGVEGQFLLKHVGFVYKKYEYTGKNERISLKMNDKFVKFFNRTFSIREQIKDATPKYFFSTLLGIPEDMVLYTNGLSEANFKKVRNISTKEFEKYKDILTAYATHGFRFCFDELERVKVFCDYDATQVIPQLIDVDETNIMDIESSTDSYLIANVLKSSFKKRQTLYDFEALGNKYLNFLYKIENISYTMLDIDDKVQVLELNNEDLFKRVTYKDYVLLKDKLNGNEFYGYVVDLDKSLSNKTSIVFGNFDKDYRLLEFGKISYLKDLGYGSSRDFDLYYVKSELPTIVKHIRKFEKGDRDDNLRLPLLPQIIGANEEAVEYEMSFGSPQDLKIGKYSGIYEEIDGIYGTWDNTKLLYNRELDQFSNTTYPNIAVLSNTIINPTGNSNDSIEKFDTYDNRNLEITINKSTNSDSDIKVSYKNTKQISTNDLKIDQPIEYTSSILLKVNSLSGYNVGDVLVVNLPDNPTTQQSETYELTKDIKYTVKKTTSSGSDYFLQVDSDFPYYTNTGSSTKIGFPFTRYPYNSIVYLMEFYIKGNPVIEVSQEVLQINQDSIDEYSEVEYVLDGRFFNETDFKTAINYFKYGFSGLDKNSLKQIIPIEVNKRLNIQKGDVIGFKDSIYTKTEVSQLWYVLSESTNEKTLKYKYNLINLNTFDANSDNVDLAELMDYAPINDPIYNHTSDDDAVDDTTPIVEGNDKDLGSISLKEVVYSEFNAKTFLINNESIQMDGFSGTKVNTFKELFFPSTGGQEFVIKINNESIYVKSFNDGEADKESVSILKRNLFNNINGEQILVADLDVKFYQIVQGTTTDGIFKSQSMRVGMEGDYFEFTPEDKVKIKTSGLIDFTNTRNRLYFDPSDISNKSQILLDVTDPTALINQGTRFQIGDTLSVNPSSKGYFKYDSANGAELFGNITIAGENSLLFRRGDGYDAIFTDMSYGGGGFGFHGIKYATLTDSLQGDINLSGDYTTAGSNFVFYNKLRILTKSMDSQAYFQTDFICEYLKLNARHSRELMFNVVSSDDGMSTQDIFTSLNLSNLVPILPNVSEGSYLDVTDSRYDGAIRVYSPTVGIKRLQVLIDGTWKDMAFFSDLP